MTKTSTCLSARPSYLLASKPEALEAECVCTGFDVVTSVRRVNSPSYLPRLRGFVGQTCGGAEDGPWHEAHLREHGGGVLHGNGGAGALTRANGSEVHGQEVRALLRAINHPRSLDA